MGIDHKSSQWNIDFGAVIDRMSEGLLIFDMEGKLVLDNAAARQILGANLVVMRQQGWSAYAMLVDSNPSKADDVRAKALRQTEPIRFHMNLSDAYIPCWATGVHQTNGEVLTVITIERPDWTPLTQLLENFRKEMVPAIEDTQGHAKFIIQIANRRRPNTTADELAQRVIGFAELISTQMERLQILMGQLHRLEIIRTGQLEDEIKQTLKTINLLEFIEDFIEEVANKQGEATRDRIQVDITDDLNITAAPKHLEYILRDVLQNALLYSSPQSPIQLRAFSTNQSRHVQIDVIDQGCGIRETENDRVFALFQRARQPQVIAEFGYGISLHLAKADMEVMGGRIWFTSEEGVGTTFSLKFSTALA